MKKLTIEPPPERALEINGEKYTVLLSDFEILELLAGIVGDTEALAESAKAENGAGLAKADNAADAAVSLLERVFSALDAVLGEGAVKKILGGRPASINYMLENVVLPVLSAIVEEAQNGYSQRIESEYGAVRQ